MTSLCDLLCKVTDNWLDKSSLHTKLIHCPLTSTHKLRTCIFNKLEESIS